MSGESSETNLRQERRRVTGLGPVERRWMMTETITWIERQPRVLRITPANRLQLQRAKPAIDHSDEDHHDAPSR